VRVVAATNRPLEKLVEQGEFRADLYYRLNIFPVELPPLRERHEDLRPLGLYLLERHARQMHRPVPRVAEALWRELEAYDWPGNVRELENLLERALILSPTDELALPEDARAVAPSAEPSRTANALEHWPSFDEQVRELLERALEQTDGRIYGKRGAAALLDLKPTTLQGKLKRLGLR